MIIIDYGVMPFKYPEILAASDTARSNGSTEWIFAIWDCPMRSIRKIKIRLRMQSFVIIGHEVPDKKIERYLFE